MKHSQIKSVCEKRHSGVGGGVFVILKKRGLVCPSFFFFFLFLLQAWGSRASKSTSQGPLSPAVFTSLQQVGLLHYMSLLRPVNWVKGKHEKERATTADRRRPEENNQLKYIRSSICRAWSDVNATVDDISASPAPPSLKGHYSILSDWLTAALKWCFVSVSHTLQCRPSLCSTVTE